MASDDDSLIMRKFSGFDLAKHFEQIPFSAEGKVCTVVGNLIEASLPKSHLSSLAEISVGQDKSIMAEVVGFKGEKTLLFPFTPLNGITPGALVKCQRGHNKITVGPYLLGNVIDGFLQPLDRNKPLATTNRTTIPLERAAPNPIERQRIARNLSLGVKALDTLFTFGEGQRIGLMAGSGVGKSVLMGMIARWSTADINVIGLIGERGREVREFIERELGPEGLAKSVVVVATSDQSPLMRLRAARVVTAIAEYFSSNNKKVLLMMDSLTRVAQAQREVGLAVGEPPTTKGYPPSVFSLLPRLLERCGTQSTGHGSISGIYTVLVDGDDFNDPIPDNARAILDGHIVLSRSLASRGHFPAIDVPASISRVMPDIVSRQHLAVANKVKALVSVFFENLDYIQIGTYQPGTNPLLDEALTLMPNIEQFLRQDMNEKVTFEHAMQQLVGVFQAPTRN